MTDFPDPFPESMQGIVNAAGTLILKFGPAYNNKWKVQQIAIEMPTAPAGAKCIVRRMGSPIARSFSAKYGTASGDPPIPLNGGESMTVEWTGCTPGDVGIIYYQYMKSLY